MLALALLVAAAARCPALPRVTIPDTAEARQALREVIFAPIGTAARAAARTMTQPAEGRSVYFRTESSNGAVYQTFTRGDLGAARLDTAGTFIIKRSRADGSFVQAKIFLQDDPGCYARLTPLGERTALEITLFGRTFQRGVILAARFESLLTAPLERIMRLAEPAVDWDLLQPAERTDADSAVERTAASIRRALPRLGDAEDGAMDAAGRMVLIRDGSPQGATSGLNCSGFAKWVVDGFFRPLTGTLTDIATLKERDLGIRGNRWTSPLEESHDLFFGIDWSRHLARELARARDDGAGSVESWDVRDAPGFSYVDDVGYAIADLATVLFRLVRSSPGRIYLGSVNRPVPGDPGLRQHDHLVVLLPYVDAGRVFRVAVFERSAETSTGSLAKRYPSDFIHLVRFDARGDFDPPIPRG
ncbi:MAG: hypothetical protein A2177_14950 [Spirochaetes bacterium RBG_13_68_11]|nr:MAG: hypothetical protein A2177_14950 [Spirochaetes bacterium RBG_13_68_11]